MISISACNSQSMARQAPASRTNGWPEKSLGPRAESFSLSSIHEEGKSGAPQTPQKKAPALSSRTRPSQARADETPVKTKPAYPSLLCQKSPREVKDCLKIPRESQTPPSAPKAPSTSACNAVAAGSEVFVPCSGHGATFTATTPANQVMLEIVSELSLNDQKIKTVVKQSLEDIGCRGGVDSASILLFRSTIAKALGLPQTVFPDVQRQHIRFDLDSKGVLDEQQAYMMVKMNLWEHRKKLGVYESGVEIPEKTMDSAGYSLLEELGRGNQCKAALARTRSGELRCVKAYDKAKTGALELDGFREEFEILKHIGGHENIASVQEVFQDNRFYYMVQPVYHGKDFTTLQKLARRSGVSTTEHWYREIFHQCFEGLAHLHRHGIMHGDIKESNLMLETDDYARPSVVIIDFGLVQTAVSDAKVVWGTPGYIAPETWATGKSFPGGDMFAMGVVILQMLLNKIPPHHNPPKGEILPGGIFTEGLRTIKEVSNATRTRSPPFNSLVTELPLLTELTKQLLDMDVEKRPSARKALQDSWFVPMSKQVQSPFEDAFPGLAPLGDLLRTWFA